MASSYFGDKTSKPDELMLHQALGNSFMLWMEIRDFLNSKFENSAEEWKFYNSKSGWLLKTLVKKRNLFFFVPKQGYFSLSFIFGDKAAAEIERSNLPQDIIESLKKAVKYMEGRGINLEIKTGEDVKVVQRLIEIKTNNN